ncbi:MAG TPA: M23 family metallopeptidase [Longimicrobiales bacterium]|nr:M23 family metallopeptidase [Longimicrobiales bacterium]
MARREWNLWIVDDDETDIRRYSVSRNAVRLAIGGALIAVAFLGSALTQLIHRAGTSIENHRLASTNLRLAGELESLRSRVDTLRTSLDVLAANDEQYRALAGLQPLDADVRRVGIGGPGMETLTASPLYPLDREAAAATVGASIEVDELLRRARLLAFSWREAGDALEDRRDDMAATPAIMPTEGYITSGFSLNRLHPILGIRRPHLGLDIVASPGTPVVATADGRVSFVGRKGEFGITVEIDHGFGRMTRYAHLARATARRGQRVERGDAVGDVGNTGLAVGTHLHYEVFVDGRPANPRSYILDDVSRN